MAPNEIRHRNVATDTKAHQSLNELEPMFHACYVREMDSKKQSKNSSQYII